MKRTIAATALCAAALVLAGCTSADSDSSDAKLRQSACGGFASLTPGSYEIGWASDTRADPNASAEDRTEALRLLAGAAERTRPYDCDDPRDAKYFASYYETFLAANTE